LNKLDRPQSFVRPQAAEWKSDVAAEMLRRLGIPYIPLVPGASYRGFHDSLVNYLGNDTPQMLLCLHEDHAVSISHGYAKATDEPLACVLHSNVGLMHGLMGIFNAWCDRAPMLVIGATGPVQPERRRPWIDWIHTAKDQGSLLRDYTKWDDEPRSSHGVIEALLRGYQITSAEPQAPVYVCLDAGLQEDAAEDNIAFPNVARYTPAPPPAAPPQTVDVVANLIRKAKCPLFMFGRGSRNQDDWDRRVSLVERCGALVMTSVRERSIFPTDHPAHAVTPFSWLSPEVHDLLVEADLIVSFDWVDLNGLLRQVNRNPSDLPATIVQASLDSTLHNGWSMDYFGLAPADHPVMAHPDTFVEQLLREIEEGTGQKKWPSWKRPVKTVPSYSDGHRNEITPLDVEIALSEFRGDRSFALAHVNLGWSATAYNYRDPLDFLGHDGGGGLAAGPGITVGAALALRGTGRPVIAVIGDGDFMQGATVLWTAARYSIPALFIIANNRSNFNDEVHQETVANVRGRPVENKWIGQRIDEPALDLSAIARAQGVEAEGPVKNVPELLAAMGRGLAAVEAGRPYLIDAHVKPGYAKKILTRGD
jgi:thiamine pyrophosphate-dependent acetolactate synthase large subunit-like protein